MNEDRESQFHFLPAIVLIGLVGVLIVTAFVLLSGIPEPAFLTSRKRVPAAVVPVLASETPTETVTITPSATSRPTWTLQPSMTSTATLTSTWTPTATRERFPTLTAARPFQINERYEFVSLNADRMDQIVRTLADYPDAAFPTSQRRLDPAYDAYFIYPALAYQEALLRFPTAAQADRWHWGLAYSQARLGETQAVDFYRRSISRVMNQAGISVEELSAWFANQTPDLSLLVHTLDVIPGQPALFLLEIPEGNVFYLFNPDITGENAIYALSEGFDFQNGGKAKYAALDLDADGSLELALYKPEASGAKTLAAPRFFKLGGTVPQELPVEPLKPFDYQMDFSINLSSGFVQGSGGQVLDLSAVFYPACPFTAKIAYQWDEETAGVKQVGLITYQLEPVEATLTYCEPLLDHAQALWPLEARRAVEEALLPFWPPETDPQGRPYPVSNSDELHFRYGLTLTLLGYPDELQEANRVLEELAQAPRDPDGPWSQTARQFLDVLGDGSGLYQACQDTQTCDIRQAFQRIARHVDPRTVVVDLPRLGITVRSRGNFDFDQDGNAEHWVLLRPRSNAELEFWILEESGPGFQALFVDLVDINNPQPFWADPQVYPGVFQIQADLGYRMLHLASDSSGYLELVDVRPVLTTYTRDEVFHAEKALMAGESPAQVRDALLTVLDSGRFNCLNDRICDRFWYTLGLAYELAGDYGEARDTYIKLWWENSRSPLTALARLKLNFISPTTTPTRIPTQTRTPTLSSTPGSTPSVTATATP